MAMSNYLKNKLTDQVWRGQAYSFPSIFHFALMTSAPNGAGGGTEVSAASYERVAVACSMTNFAGTQGAGTTVASTGTNGTTSNNALLEFPDPDEAWGVVTHMAIYDAATSGNLLFYSPLANPKTINAGDDAPAFAPGEFLSTIG